MASGTSTGIIGRNPSERTQVSGREHLVILSAPAWIGLRRHQRVTELASSVLHHRHPAVLRGCGVRRVVVCGSQSELHNLVFHGHRCAQFGTGTAGIGG